MIAPPAMATLGPTLSLGAAEARVWDLLIVGAGPAGAMAAYEAARHGIAVLMIDKATFPRFKVCGCCISAAAVTLLGKVGLRELLEQRAPHPPHALERLELISPGHRASVPLPGGVALSRWTFDAALIRSAIECGAEFLPARAALDTALRGSTREVVVKGDHGPATLRGRVVLVASGLAGRFLDRQAGLTVRRTPDSRIGLGAMLDAPPALAPPGRIRMVCGRRGYVGMVRLEDGLVDVAAALDPIFVREVGSPAAAVEVTLREAGVESDAAIASASWCGTPKLTAARARISAARMLVLGDAAGYVEPITGDGIYRALLAGRTAVRHAAEALRAQSWTTAMEIRWARHHQALMRRRFRSCRRVSRVLRSPPMTGGLVSALSVAPWLARPFVRSVWGA